MNTQKRVRRHRSAGTVNNQTQKPGEAAEKELSPSASSENQPSNPLPPPSAARMFELHAKAIHSFFGMILEKRCGARFGGRLECSRRTSMR